MIQEPELEEGETCYYKDDASIDPDIALSYIGDKVQSILGHLQKDFEGGVSAENLGAKFGGYGSFLPMHQRSPPIWSQPRSPQRVQNPHLPPNHVPAPNSVMVPDAPSTQRDGSSSSSSMRASQTLKTSFDDVSIREKATLSSDKVAKAFPGKVELPSTKSGNPPDQRTLKVRIKMGPDRVAQYNAEIYNLGLTSPSSSEGNSHEESEGLQLESNETPNESPANILRIMTSLPVSGGLLLSPLCEDLLNLTREMEYSVDSDYQAAPKSSAISLRLLNNGVFGGKKTKFVDKNRNVEQSEDEHIMDLDDLKQKTLGCKPLTDTVRESEKDVQVQKRKGSKDRVRGRAISGDLVKDTSLERTSDQSVGKYEQPESRCSSVEKVREHHGRIPQKDVSVDHGQGNRSQANGIRASHKFFSDNSEGEVVKGTMDKSSLKVGPNATSSEQNGFGMSHDVNRLSLKGEKKSKVSHSSGKSASKEDSSRDGGSAAPENRYSGKNDVRRLHLSQEDVVHTSLEHKENSKRLLERPSSEKPKNFKPDAAKAKSARADKLKDRSSNKKYFDKVTSNTHIAEPPAAAIHSKEGIFSGLEQTVVAPVVIQEDWVGCDRCQKWRLLPYGTKSEQLPDKWVCSMLDWLPGMNNCDISEDETTKAVQALYLVPISENQRNLQAHADGTMAGVMSASAHHFDQNHQSRASDQVKKQKLKEKQNTASMSDPVPSYGKKHLKRPVKDGSSKEVKQSLVGVNATNKSDMQHPNKSAIVGAKLNKRKGEHVIGDDANPRKKIKSEHTQHVDGKVKKIKPKGVLALENFQISGGNSGMIGHSLTSGLPNKESVKDGKRKSAQKDATSGGASNFKIYVKAQKDQVQDLPDNGPLRMKQCNDKEVSTKKIKLKDSQHQVETQQTNGSKFQDRKASNKEDSKDCDFHRDKKPRVSQIEEKEFKRSQGDDISKRRSVEARVQSLGSKEYPINRGIEKEEQVQKPRVKLRLTIEDIDKLRKDLGCEQLPTAATSSSSKVSDSRKNRIPYMEVKGSPEESVSSSPARMPYPNQVSPMMMETVGRDDSRFNNVPAVGRVKKFRDMNGRSDLGTARKGRSGLTNDNGSEILDSKNKLKDETDVDDNHCAPKHEVSSNMRHPFSDSIKSVKNGTSVGKRNLRKLGDSRSEDQFAEKEHDNNDVKSSYPCSTDVMQQNLNQELPRSSVEQTTPMEPWSGKLRIDLRQGDKQGAVCPSKHVSGSLGSLKRSSMDSRPLDASTVGDTSKALKDTAIACLQNGTDDFINNGAELSVPLDASLRNKNVSGSAASKEAEDILKEAEELRSHADLIKNSGFGSESNYEYFKAALKFLHGGSLLEACNGESGKHLEMNPMQMYGTAAKLCKICAYEYEKGREMAAAALAYKCVEVAYLRVVYCKSATTNRVWHDLHSSLQLVSQGESPSSSASDIDNLNNLATAEKVTSSKSSGSHAANHVIVPRNRPNFVRLLDFTKDVNSAMEAAKKSQDIFLAAHVELEESQNKEAIVSVKKVIDFSFQNIDELVRLVRFALNTINHQRLSSGRH